MNLLRRSGLNCNMYGIIPRLVNDPGMNSPAFSTPVTWQAPSIVSNWDSKMGKACRRRMTYGQGKPGAQGPPRFAIWDYRASILRPLSSRKFLKLNQTPDLRQFSRIDARTELARSARGF
ncbi:predicted protein [Histoplasma capsulatum G186AR]|uniref:Uncharacterized protein n=1 Tax=Ajellomyces capsulatus (strain G186AR / H82 / ATCC MYA-2454 / RMSCC 2432) TaxID=447093 RepID=C0NPZ9_AJECG|nr:uncharacterized protein HCBG_05229 [Histoplasma capsulatum G186AR]EEH07009.1 predicted protein [Histoplasma capsulatum G186AR]